MSEYKLVPVEPTPEMLEAGADWCGHGLGTDEAKGRAATAYKSMLAAAPDVQGGVGGISSLCSEAGRLRFPRLFRRKMELGPHSKV